LLEVGVDGVAEEFKDTAGLLASYHHDFSAGLACAIVGV
jgi:hypothetical protein